MSVVNEKRSGSEELNQDPVVDLNIKRGPSRPYVVSEPPEKLGKLRTVHTRNERLLVATLAVITGAVRLYNLSWPNSVIFDEVHFGKFASYYIRNSFFMDVHPPLAKMMFAWIASLVGFEGNFDFDSIGKFFPANVPYILMRSLAATTGALTVIMLYFTLRASGVRVWIAFVSGLCFALENSYVTISRYILLDAPLIFFISASAYCFKRYELYPSGTSQSFRYLVATGVCLGLASSAKWVGLFTVAWVGVLCLWRLWFFVGDLSKPVCSTFKIAAAKGSILLGVPLLLYTFFFYLHFETLDKDGEGAGFFSPEFRTSLKGNNIPQNVMAEVGTGSVVTIRHTGTMGGYLHSHPHDFPGGSQQQQITLYPHLDANNEWYVMLYDQPNNTVTSFENLADGTKIRLLHPLSYRRLHSHDHKPPVSENSDWQKEVSCYGFEGFEGDANDDWVIEIDKDASAPGPAQERVRALETKFRLRHAMMNCYLFSHEVKLPKWGYDQQEVTCAYSGLPSLTLWAVEQSYNEFLPEDTEIISYKPSSFWQKLVEYHQKMWHINNNLVDSHVYESMPSSWPFLLRGIGYWSQHHRHVYLLGNAILWWSVTAFIVIFGLVVAGELVAWQLGKPILQDSRLINFHIQVIQYLLGYAIHLAPFFLMQRQMFLHHYLPAYYFGILAFGHALDILVTYVLRRQRTVGYIVIGVFVLSCLHFFKKYSPIIYGLPWTKQLCEKSQWLSGWDYSCANYLDTYEEYSKLDLNQGLLPEATAAV
ncbi:dolichyl-phosphate-mannose--protein mannosyltransferase 1 [Zygosaccharomyces mellis]|uniref:Dolichyl-phosphate-mannose--protein mannosyltransferase n=1 Tax=Zygosaccharomyces mellis TaxID=42258 RepID=A0A4C2E285_9SACH|nr:dolichyl-phosphate-mannose--protein mannosyltransferase 1 [Zygosaccharomyces mellis]